MMPQIIYALLIIVVLTHDIVFGLCPTNIKSLLDSIVHVRVPVCVFWLKCLYVCGVPVCVYCLENL